MARGVYVVSSDICDYEVRRGLSLTFLITSQETGLSNLDALHSISDFSAVSPKVLKKAAQLWAESRIQGQPTADSKNIDADVIIAATCQLLQSEYPGQNLIIATTNVKHLSRFATAQVWQTIKI